MKNILVLSMLVSSVMICSCQRKDSTAEQQLAQRKVELDAREEALAERLNSLEEKVNWLDQRMKELAEKEKAAMNTRTNTSDVQGQTPDPAQVQAHRESIIQRFATRRPDPIAAKAEKDEFDRKMQEQSGQSQPESEELQRAKQSKDAMGMTGGAVFPAPAATLPIPSPAVEATSPSPPPAVEDTSPSPAQTPE